jgi:hypothetical protein
MLFEDRLGGILYRPIGREWLDGGYWRIAEIYNNHETTIFQYLGIHDDYIMKDGVCDIWETGHEYYQHAITLDRFFKTPIDIVIASVPEHIASFKRLSDEHPNKPKFIYQIGNAWPIEAGMASNVMASAKISSVPENVNLIEYHQEFDTKIFCPVTGAPDNNIYSYINCLNSASIYAHDWPLFTQLESLMSSWRWRAFGGSCRDGGMNGQKAVAESIQEARFVWHVKAGGDGYGHILHNALAIGRPVIVKKEYYAGKMAEPLLIDGVSCIAIDNLAPHEIVAKILHYNEPLIYAKLCQDTYKTFVDAVDFDKEEIAMRNFLDKLI